MMSVEWDTETPFLLDDERHLSVAALPFRQADDSDELCEFVVFLPDAIDGLPALEVHPLPSASQANYSFLSI